MVETEETARKMDANLKKRAVRREQTVQEELLGIADPDKARVVMIRVMCFLMPPVEPMTATDKATL
jgi:hypothetical protein